MKHGLTQLGPGILSLLFFSSYVHLEREAPEIAAKLRTPPKRRGVRRRSRP